MIVKIRFVIVLVCISLFSWWAIKAVIKYWSQPLTTEISFTFGDNENRIQFPLITLCQADFVSLALIKY